MVVAAAALIVALTGTAIAAEVVPLAKRARVADNAKKLVGKTPVQIASMPGPATTLEGKTAAQIAETPGPASAVASLVVYKTGTRSIGPGEIVDTTTACDQGQKAIGGGFQGPDENLITIFDTRPSSDGGAWRLRLGSFSPEDSNVTLIAVCVK
jgi:hypothetical protein